MAKKSFLDLLREDTPKSQKKLNKAIESGNCQSVFQAFKMEALTGNVRDFPQLGMLVTDHFVCRYFAAMAAFTGPLVIIPIEVIGNLYRTNLDMEGKYDPQNFWLAVETKDNKLVKLGNYYRTKDDSLYMFQDIIEYIRTKMF